MTERIKQGVKSCSSDSLRGSRLRLPLILLLLIPLFLAVRPLSSQQAPAAQAQGPPITVHVKVVNVLATVRDKKGAIVRNLDQGDFELKEDDRPQQIRYFPVRPIFP